MLCLQTHSDLQLCAHKTDLTPSMPADKSNNKIEWFDKVTIRLKGRIKKWSICKWKVASENRKRKIERKESAFSRSFHLKLFECFVGNAYQALQCKHTRKLITLSRAESKCIESHDADSFNIMECHFGLWFKRISAKCVCIKPSIRTYVCMCIQFNHLNFVNLTKNSSAHSSQCFSLSTIVAWMCGSLVLLLRFSLWIKKIDQTDVLLNKNHCVYDVRAYARTRHELDIANVFKRTNGCVCVCVCRSICYLKLIHLGTRLMCLKAFGRRRKWSKQTNRERYLIDCY